MIENMRTPKTNKPYATYTALRHEMKQGLAGMWSDLRLPPDIQKKRVAAVMKDALTPLQRDIIAMYLSGMTLREIATARGVCPSSVCRSLHRGIARLKKYLRF
jgi:DNA-directed RNA polymerase specialized sigma24 family protein